MSGSCYLCRDKPRIAWSGYYCKECKRLQDAIAIYGDRVYEVVEEVLFRSPDKQNLKIKCEIKKEIKIKQCQIEEDKKSKL